MVTTWTDADEVTLIELYGARDSGALIVRHGDTMTQFRSLSEMERIIAKLERRKAGANGTTRQRLFYPWQSSKGL